MSCDVIRPQMVASEWTILLELMILGYPLVSFYISLLKMVIEIIVDLPSYKMVIFHSYVAVYQRVPPFQETSTYFIDM